MRINQFYSGPDLITVVEVGPTKAVFSMGGNQIDLLANILEDVDGTTTASWIGTTIGQKTKEILISIGRDGDLVENFVAFCGIELQDELRKIFGIGQEPKAVEARRRVTISDIQKRVADFYSVSVDNMKGRVKTKRIARARHVAMYLSSRLTGMSSTNIGRKFNRDHSTILYAVDQIESKITTQKNEEDNQLGDDVQFLMSEFMRDDVRSAVAEGIKKGYLDFNRPQPSPEEAREFGEAVRGNGTLDDVAHMLGVSRIKGESDADLQNRIDEVKEGFK